MGEPKWINRHALLLKHAESLRLFGGAEGLRDEGMFDSALARPMNAWSYRGEARIPWLAAAYAFGLSKSPLHRWKQARRLHRLCGFFEVERLQSHRFPT